MMLPVQLHPEPRCRRNITTCLQYVCIWHDSALVQY